MKKTLRTALFLVLALAMIPTQAGAVETVATLSVDDEDTRSADFTSDPTGGVAVTFFTGGTAGPEYTCGDLGPNCEYFLIEATGLSQEEIDAATAAGIEGSLSDRVTVDLGIRQNAMAGDIDIIIYESDADATKGNEIGREGALDTDLVGEEFSTTFTATAAQPTHYFLVEVVMFAGAGIYDGYVDVF